MRNIAPLFIGMVFGLGIAISGMANPAKVLNFFDIFGTFDPSLIFVMFSAMFTAMAGYRYVLAQPKPLYEEGFSLPATTKVDAPLLLGSAVFGIGWGICGFCPGGAIPALGLGRVEPAVFVAAMAAGIGLTRAFRDYRARGAATA